MKKRIIFSAFLLLLLKAAAQQPDANQIMNTSRDLTLAASMTSDISLIITEKNGSVRKRLISMSTKSYSDGTEKRLIKFLEPSDVKGTGLLVIDNKNAADEMWIYLPALRKTRRIISSEKGRNFMSSEFSNADMTSPSLSDFNYKHFQGSGEKDKWIIEGIPVKKEIADEYGFSKKLSYFNSTNLRLERMEFYNFDNQLFKVIEVKSTQPLDDKKYIIKDMVVRNLLSGRSSEISFGKINVNSKIEDSVFTLQNLER